MFPHDGSRSRINLTGHFSIYIRRRRGDEPRPVRDREERQEPVDPLAIYGRNSSILHMGTRILSSFYVRTAVVSEIIVSEAGGDGNSQAPFGPGDVSIGSKC